jgi:hypothetical protein
MLAVAAPEMTSKQMQLLIDAPRSQLFTVILRHCQLWKHCQCSQSQSAVAAPQQRQLFLLHKVGCCCTGNNLKAKSAVAAPQSQLLRDCQCHQSKGSCCCTRNDVKAKAAVD